MSLKGYIPPVGFYYAVYLIGENGNTSGANSLDAAFQEVSGIAATMDTTTIQAGGVNQFAYTIPKGTISFDDLVLKRGLMVWKSKLSLWVHEHLLNNINGYIEPKELSVHLLDTNTKDPIMAWEFHNVYPKKWEVSNLTADKSDIAVESLTLCYSNFTLTKDLTDKYKPYKVKK